MSRHVHDSRIEQIRVGAMSSVQQPASSSAWIHWSILSYSFISLYDTSQQTMIQATSGASIPPKANDAYPPFAHSFLHFLTPSISSLISPLLPSS